MGTNKDSTNGQIFNGKYFFTKEHEWIRLEQDVAFVGLTNAAKRELGLVNNIEIHTVGKDLIENQVFGMIRTKKYLCHLIMPLRGIILEANTFNYESFNDMNKGFDPDEWLVKIAISFPLKSEKLCTLEDYNVTKIEQGHHLVKYFLKFGE